MKLIFACLDCDLSALFARSTLTKYHFDCSQYHWWIKPVETPESALVSCSAKFTCSQKYLYVYCNVNCKTFWPPRETCKSMNKSGEVVAGQVSNGDFHCESPNDVLATEPIKQGQKKALWVATLIREWSANGPRMLCKIEVDAAASVLRAGLQLCLGQKFTLQSQALKL